ncbi:MAG: DUF3806 domain-containing protein [Halioglobus sp.]
MKHLRPWSYLMLVLTWALCTQAMAKDELIVSNLTQVDLQYMQQQRALLGDLTARHFGRQFNGSRDNDLGLLQRLLDQELVRNDQTRELQAMGIIMGDLLAAELGMDWVVYEDRLGRSRALRYKETDSYLFPATMISRRRAVDNRTPVADIYRKAQDTMGAVIPPLPFQ